METYHARMREAQERVELARLDPTHAIDAVAAADAAREATFPLLSGDASESNEVPTTSRITPTEAFASATFLYAQAVSLLPRDVPLPKEDTDDKDDSTACEDNDVSLGDRGVVRSGSVVGHERAAVKARAMLRAIDLTILRGGPEWAAKTRDLNLAASRMLEDATVAADGVKRSVSVENESKRRRIDNTGACGTNTTTKGATAGAMTTTTTTTTGTAPQPEDATPCICPHWSRGEATGKLSHIPRIAADTLSPEAFRQHYLATETPVIITGAIDHWPAMGGSGHGTSVPAPAGASDSPADCATSRSRRWNLDYLKRKAGDRLVPVEVCDEQDRTQTYLTDTWERLVMPMRDYIDAYIAPDGSRTVPPADGDRGYLAQHALFDQIPILEDDIEIPVYCHQLLQQDASTLHDTTGDSVQSAAQPSKDTDTTTPLQAAAEKATRLSTNDVQVSAWFGPAGTVSPLHHDPYHNVFAQVVGRKYVRLYPKEQTPALYPRGDALCNNSWVDLDNVDTDRFPLFEDATGHHAVLLPGDLLHIPRGCWHYLTSIDVSFSVSFWWGARL
eukprot:m.198953 g.198953  ORF g.198953 m.198953 type:complete len:560 (-) comp20621_c0_seq1:57-1736(-)